MSKVVIVESPAKAKTINKYLGKDYDVVSSFGHIRDLPLRSLGVDVENKFNPQYEISIEKKKIVNELKSKTQNADFVYLASDDDREGEAISWHLKEVLSLPEDKTKRIVFHEITEKAIKNAISNPREINMDLVESQQARRILDRLVGYKASPVLWNKIKRGLSAGRVQSVAVRLIVEREREVLKFNSDSSFKINVVLQTKNNSIIQVEKKKNVKTKEEAYNFLEQILKNKEDFIVMKVEKKRSSRSPIAPFTTSTLQQEASTKLGFSVSQTMTLAQHLYESGKITYMRTDSVILSEEAIKQAADVIKSEFGDKYVQNRQFKTKSKLAQEAHEAIRPTHFKDVQVSSDEKEQKLYMLIRRRALASQMADAIIDRTVITIENEKIGEEGVFTVSGEVVFFDGFLKLYNVGDKDDDEEGNNSLPNVCEGDKLECLSAMAIEKFTKPPTRFSEAGLVKELEEKGIGRPSTYATIITTIQKRGYVVKESKTGIKKEICCLKLERGIIKEEKEIKTEGSEKNKLFPTDVAYIVNDFLVEYFPDITDYNFTANIEKQLDDIAEDKVNWIEMLTCFYTNFNREIQACSASERVSVKNPSRELGVDPVTNKKVYCKITRYGAVVQIGDFDDTQKPQFLPLLPGQNVETISLGDALKLKNFPKNLGEYKGINVVLNNGVYGPYVSYGNKNIKIYDCSNILDFNLDRAIDLIVKLQKK